MGMAQPVRGYIGINSCTVSRCSDNPHHLRRVKMTFFVALKYWVIKTSRFP
jgi:hypothetical protein